MSKSGQYGCPHNPPNTSQDLTFQFRAIPEILANTFDYATSNGDCNICHSISKHNAHLGRRALISVRRKMRGSQSQFLWSELPSLYRSNRKERPSKVFGRACEHFVQGLIDSILGLETGSLKKRWRAGSPRSKLTAENRTGGSATSWMFTDFHSLGTVNRH
jgi:hypothetical protein